MTRTRQVLRTPHHRGAVGFRRCSWERPMPSRRHRHRNDPAYRRCIAPTPSASSVRIAYSRWGTTPFPRSFRWKSGFAPSRNLPSTRAQKKATPAGCRGGSEMLWYAQCAALRWSYFTNSKTTRRFFARLMSESRVLAGSSASIESAMNRSEAMPNSPNFFTTSSARL